MTKRRCLFLAIVITLMSFTLPCFAAKQITVYYPRPESNTDNRYVYHTELLKIALEKTIRKWGPAKIAPSRNVMNELRMKEKLIKGESGIDILFRPTSIEDERLLTPIRIPLDKGLLGYRIFLIHKKKQPRFKSIASIEELKLLHVGQGRDWNDVKIYKHNDFNVITASKYENLFKMLLKGRFDYFARGVEEAPPEFDARSEKMPGLHVEESIVLYYPFPRYMWVANNAKGKMLHARITEGLEIMIKDGSFDRTFYKYKRNAIERAKLVKRKMFTIDNPFLPVTTPLDRPELWYKPLDRKKKS